MELRIIRSIRKTVSISIDEHGDLIVRAPFTVSHHQIEDFLIQNADWIQDQQKKSVQNKRINHQYHEGERFLFLGKEYPLMITNNQMLPFTLDGCLKLHASELKNAEAVISRWYRQQARQIINPRLQALASKYGFQYNRFRLSGARTRWGSCSFKKNINISWRLVMAPEEVIDYVLLHELVHLEIQNHSKAFWSRLGSILPNYKEYRDWLKKNGKRLII